MKDINSALRSHRKPDKPELYQLIVIVNFNQVISYRRLIETRLIVNIPTLSVFPQKDCVKSAGVLLRAPSKHGLYLR